MYIDTHAHLYLEQFDKDIDEIMLNAQSAQVGKVFLPNIDRSSIDSLLNLSNNYPNQCYPMIGLHPCSVNAEYEIELDYMYKLLKEKKFYGVGETGIDLYWDKSFKKEQINSFKRQIEWAKEFDLPVIIHSRDALDLTIEIIESAQDGNLKGIFHCFNGTIEQCQKIVDKNFMMGIGGIVTYKNAKLDEMIKYLPLDALLLETDAPYLSPVPYRGKRNESAYIPLIAQKIADVKSISKEQIMEITSANALKLFNVDA